MQSGHLLASEFNEFRERGRIVDGQFGKALAIEFDLRLFEPGHKLAVGKPVSADACADARDPQLAEFPFAVPPVPICIRFRVHYCFVSVFIMAASRAAIAFCRFGDLVGLRPCCNSPFNARHD